MVATCRQRLRTTHDILMLTIEKHTRIRLQRNHKYGVIVIIALPRCNVLLSETTFSMSIVMVFYERYNQTKLLTSMIAAPN